MSGPLFLLGSLYSLQSHHKQCFFAASTSAGQCVLNCDGIEIVDRASMTFNQIAAACPDIGWYRGKFGTANCNAKEDLVWPTKYIDGLVSCALDGCPRCECSAQSLADEAYINYRNRRCQSCGCQVAEDTLSTFEGETKMIYQCKQPNLNYINSWGPSEWPIFQCPLTTKCVFGDSTYSVGDFWWTDSLKSDGADCNKFCICKDDGSSYCKDTIQEILEGDNLLTMAFLAGHGKFIDHCLDEPSLIKYLPTSDGASCPSSLTPSLYGTGHVGCGCPAGQSEGDAYPLQRLDLQEGLRTGIATCGYYKCTDSYSEKVEGGASDFYDPDWFDVNDTTKGCVATPDVTTSCYSGTFVTDQISPNALPINSYVINNASGWCQVAINEEYDEQGVLKQTKVKYGVANQALCKKYIGDDACIHVPGQFQLPSYQIGRCGMTQKVDQYIYCCQGNLCNNKLPNDVTSACPTDDKLTSLNPKFYQCFLDVWHFLNGDMFDIDCEFEYQSQNLTCSEAQQAINDIKQCVVDLAVEAVQINLPKEAYLNSLSYIQKFVQMLLKEGLGCDIQIVLPSQIVLDDGTTISTDDLPSSAPYTYSMQFVVFLMPQIIMAFIAIF